MVYGRRDARKTASTLRQKLLCQPARLGEVHFAGVFGPKPADDLAHVLHRCGAGLADRRGDRGARLGVVHLPRQEALDDGDLLALLIGELAAAGLIVDRDRFLALLDHLLQECEDLLLARLPPARAPRLDILVLERRLDHAHRRQAPLLTGLQRLLHGLGEALAHRILLGSATLAALTGAARLFKSARRRKARPRMAVARRT